MTLFIRSKASFTRALPCVFGLFALALSSCSDSDTPVVANASDEGADPGGDAASGGVDSEQSLTSDDTEEGEQDTASVSEASDGGSGSAPSSHDQSDGEAPATSESDATQSDAIKVDASAPDSDGTGVDSTDEPMASSSDREDASTHHELLPPNQIAASAAGTCAIDSLGQIVCWGPGVGVGAEPWVVPAGGFVSIHATDRMFCALSARGFPTCFRPPGNPDALPGHIPEGPLKQLALDEETLCAVDTNDVSFCRNARDWRNGEPPVPSALDVVPPEGETFAVLSSGRFFGCGLRESDGLVLCFGTEGGEQECGGSPAVNQLSPPGVELVSLSSGPFTTCGVDRNGSLHCWGAGSQPDATRLLCEVEIHLEQGIPPLGNEFSRVVVSRTAGCALRADGEVECWGQGDALCPELGCMLDDVPDGPFGDLALGDWHACAMRADRSVQCWGDGSLSTTVPEALQ